MRHLLALLLIVTGALVRAADPVAVTARLDRVGQAWQVAVAIDVPAKYHVYADERLTVTIDDHALKGRFVPPPVQVPDPMGQTELVFTGRTLAIYSLSSVDHPLRVQVTSQACSESSCYPPRIATFLLAPDGVATAIQAAATVPDEGWLAGARITTSAAGYLPVADFLAVLARGQGKGAAPGEGGGWRLFLDDPAAFLASRGMALTVLLVLVGGLLLNLTPCVLPMIPINLAIIGAGARAGSRLRGLALGATYGAGMALVYGVLGVVVVLTGTVFGALQSSPIFNGIMAALFVLLALAMFDVLPIDLTRFQPTGGSGRGFLAAAMAGGVAALLAGACVAPVVAAVLLLASTLYHGGSSLALLLPFALGAGMALPWPLAGAGLSVLPKPGAWMLWVKYAFGVLIACMSIYYGWLTYAGFAATTSAAPSGNELLAGDRSGWSQRLAQARAEGKPLLLDFHASWCKNCHAMDRTTFRDPAVRRAMEAFVVVRVSAEHPERQPAAGMLAAMGVNGLPTYVVVAPEP